MQNILKHSDHLIDLALAEDLGQFGDITTMATIQENQEGTAYLFSKDDGVVCGLELFERVFLKLDEQMMIEVYFRDGDRVKKGDKILMIKGSMRAILTAERTALNFIQRLSGVATYASKLAAETVGFSTKILDTRKTVPAYRLLDKYAAKVGGVTNHRIGLYDQFLIKDNHIQAAGSITSAVDKAKKYALEQKLSALIEVEVESVEEFLEAQNCGVDIIMLDNMRNEMIKECVKLRNGSVKIEVSGNVSLPRVTELVHFGVDFISMGSITHSVTAFDFSLLVE